MCLCSLQLVFLTYCESNLFASSNRAYLNACIPYKGVLKVNILSQKIIGRITNYRVGESAQQPRECLIEFKNMDPSAAGKLVGHQAAGDADRNALRITGRKHIECDFRNLVDGNRR